MITIAHLSDLHLAKEKYADQHIVIDALCRDLSRLRGDLSMPPDIIVFSGDLVRAGEDSADFKFAQKKFIEPVLAASGLPPDRFFIAPGNHDISRKAD